MSNNELTGSQTQSEEEEDIISQYEDINEIENNQDNQDLKIEIKEFQEPVNDEDEDDEETIHAERFEIMEQWEEKMVDFSPDDMLSFVIEKGETEIFFEHVERTTSLRGAYFVAFNDKDKLDFEVRDVKGEKILFQNKQRREGIFNIDVTEYGDYQFIFYNPSSTKQVSFALDVTHSTQKHVKHHEITDIDKILVDFNQDVRDIMRETRFSQKRSQSHLEYLEKTHSKMLYLNIFEILSIFGATVWQVYYIKKILDNKSIV